jgi:hypothetical protein
LCRLQITPTRDSLRDAMINNTKFNTWKFGHKICHICPQYEIRIFNVCTINYIKWRICKAKITAKQFMEACSLVATWCSTHILKYIVPVKGRQQGSFWNNVTSIVNLNVCPLQRKLCEKFIRLVTTFVRLE